MTKHFQHLNPIGQDESNYLIQVRLAPEDQNGSEIAYEQLYCKQLGNNRFQVCCVPFFLYDIAYGDIVELLPDGQARVIVQSGRRVVRIYFIDSTWFKPIMEKLLALNCRIEPYSDKFYAVDCPDILVATHVANILDEHESPETYEYETGRRARNVGL
jgi:hypothetical protein